MRRIVLQTLIIVAAAVAPVRAYGANIPSTLSADPEVATPAAPSLRHTVLEASSPARDTVLDASPSRLRLTFNERIDPQLATVRLLAEDGTAQPLGELVRGDSAQEIVAAITAPVAPGRYTVEWRVVGADGHPVGGDYAFTVEPPPDVEADTGDIGAAGPPAGAVPVDPGAPAPGDPGAPGPGDVQRDEPSAGPSVGSPAYVAVRWLTFAALLVAIGAVGFRWIVLGTLGRSSMAADALVAPAAERAATIGRGALVFLILAAGARLLTQLSVIAPPGAVAPGGDGNGGLLRALLFNTAWGWGWLIQVIAAIAGVLAFNAALRSPRRGWLFAAGIAVLLAITPALSGHAVAATRLPGIAVAADWTHMIAVSAWLGTLLFVIGVGIPEAIRADTSTAGRAIGDMVRIFSPAALVLAGIAAGTGVVSAVFQLSALSDLWASAYGRTLLVKLGVVALVAAAGAYNWLRIKPRLSDAADASRLRASGALELAAAAIVLLITAILVATPTP